jgi:hypothetical protein
MSRGGKRFDANPEEQDHGRHESDEADNSDSGCELEGQQARAMASRRSTSSDRLAEVPGEMSR